MKFFKLKNIFLTEERFFSILNSIKFLFDRNNIDKHNLPGPKSSINANLDFIGFTILDYCIMSLVLKSEDNSFALNTDARAILFHLNLIDSNDTIFDDVKIVASSIISFLPIEHNGKLLSMPILGMSTEIQEIEV